MAFNLARSIFFALLFIQVALAEVAVPPLNAHVTDLTNTLDSSQVQSIDTKLAEFEKTKGSQLAVLMLPTTQPETIEQYSLRVVEQWKLGRKKIDDGALLIIAKDDRKMRIEVGYGLEGALNDATAKRIIAEVITPPFKQGDFAGGITAGLLAMMQVVAGEPLPPSVRQQNNNTLNLETIIVLMFMLVFVVGSVLRTMLGRLPAAGLVGGIAGGIAWWILMPTLAVLAIGFVAFLLSLLSGTARNAGSFRSGRGGFGGDIFTGGGGSWGGGGGGGFGGGGASGSW